MVLDKSQGSRQPSQPRQPKLRFSCDACGAAKLKCDRGQPECGRCINYGVPCLYSVSRKMGRPRRDKRRTSDSQQTDGQMKSTNSSHSGRASHANNVTLDQTLLSNTVNAPASWDTIGDSGDGFSINLDMFHQPDSSFRSFNLLDKNDWSIMGPSEMVFDDAQYASLPTPAPSDLNSGSPKHIPTTQSANYQPARQKHVRHGSSVSNSTDTSSRDCSLEVSEITSSLPPLVSSEIHHQPLHAMASNLTRDSVATELPLDQMLSLNRTASERLSPLLACLCTKSPHQALLCASAISRIMIGYQQAATCTVSRSTTAGISNTVSHEASEAFPLQDVVAAPFTGLPTWLDPTARADEVSSVKDIQSIDGHSAVDVGLAKMAIGSFDVDDLRVQAALKLQLCLGEMRKLSALIDRFVGSHQLESQHRLGSDDPGSFGSVHQDLGAWLRREHSRITGGMRSKLRELDM